MKNKELVDRKLSIVDGVLTTLHRIVNTQEPIEAYRANINRAKALIEEARDLIALEHETSRPSERRR